MSETFYNRNETYEPWNPCAHLGGWELGVKITRSGHSQVYWFCADCQTAQNHSLRHAQVEARGISVADLPVFVDYRAPGERCEHCGGKDGVEYHHWAPRHLFGPTADKWPGAFLCGDCHTHWHRIVTPDMTRKKAS